MEPFLALRVAASAVSFTWAATAAVLRYISQFLKEDVVTAPCEVFHSRPKLTLTIVDIEPVAEGRDGPMRNLVLREDIPLNQGKVSAKKSRATRFIFTNLLPFIVAGEGQQTVESDKQPRTTTMQQFTKRIPLSSLTSNLNGQSPDEIASDGNLLYHHEIRSSPLLFQDLRFCAFDIWDLRRVLPGNFAKCDQQKPTEPSHFRPLHVQTNILGSLVAPTGDGDQPAMINKRFLVFGQHVIEFQECMSRIHAPTDDEQPCTLILPTLCPVILDF